MPLHGAGIAEIIRAGGIVGVIHVRRGGVRQPILLRIECEVPKEAQYDLTRLSRHK